MKVSYGVVSYIYIYMMYCLSQANKCLRKERRPHHSIKAQFDPLQTNSYYGDIFSISHRAIAHHLGAQNTTTTTDMPGLGAYDKYAYLSYL